MAKFSPRVNFRNPFRPGAGHMPPYLAGRAREEAEFLRLLDQDVILENLVLTGLRGVGKTVLLESLKPLAIDRGWLWVGTDLSEAASVSEQNMALRIVTDLSPVTSSVVVSTEQRTTPGFAATPKEVQHTLNFETLRGLFEATPGLIADKLKNVLEVVWVSLQYEQPKGLIFAYDEAQNLADAPAKDQFPLSLLLDVFQSIQRQGIPFMLALTGLPTLFPKLVDARTFAERMFRVVFLDRLDPDESRDAILKPIDDPRSPVVFDEQVVEVISRESGGYPYFIQFIGREVYDVFVQQRVSDEEQPVPMEEIVRKLDSDFFAGRWARATDRQRELLTVIAQLESAGAEFTVQEIVERSQTELAKGFSGSHVSQMLATLIEAGLLYKNRHGKYSLAVPLLDRFIRRQIEAAA